MTSTFSTVTHKNILGNIFSQFEIFELYIFVKVEDD